MNHLAKLSWQQIAQVYKKYGNQLNEYRAIAIRFDLDLPIKFRPGEIFEYTPDFADFLGRYVLGVSKLNKQLAVLDTEIARRNKLIGVMG